LSPIKRKKLKISILRESFFEFNTLNYFLFGKENRYRTAVFVVTLLLILSSIFLDPVQSFILFPFYVFFLFFFYFKKTKNFKKLFLVHLVLSMLGEIGFMLDFSKYMNFVLFINMIAQMCLIIMLRPVLKKIKIKDFGTHNLTELIIGFLGVNYIIGYVLYNVFPLIPDLTLFVPAIFSFIVVTVVCIGIPFFNKHPKAILLWGIGGGIVAEITSAFIYEYLSDARIFLVMSYIFALFVKFTLATFLIEIDDIQRFEEEEYI